MHACISTASSFRFISRIGFDWGSFERSKIDLVLFTCGFALALSFDLMFRAFGVTYDVGVNPTLLPLKFMLTIAGVVLGVLMHQESLRLEKGDIEAPFASRIGGILIPSGMHTCLKDVNDNKGDKVYDS